MGESVERTSLRGVEALLLGLLVLGEAACAGYPTPADSEEMYVKPGQGLGHRFQGDAAANYYVGIGDGIVIQVAGAPEVSGPYVVGIDGKITLPFVEDVYVGGLTRKEIAAKVKYVLGRYYRNIQVTVSVVAFNSKRYYVFGEGMRIGALPYTGDVTILDVLAIVGMNPITASDEVLLVRSDAEKPRVYTCDVDELLEGKSKRNYQVKEDDIVVIQSNVWGILADAVAKVTFPLRVITSAIFTGAYLYTVPLQIDLQRQYLLQARRYY